MKSTTVTSIIIGMLSLVGTANAGAHVKYCEKANFKGYCNCVFGPGCFNLDYMTNKITSFEVTGGTCWFYDSPNCQDPYLLVESNAKRIQLKGDTNDRISSIRCT